VDKLIEILMASLAPEA